MFLLLVDSSDSAPPLAAFDIQMISINSVLDSAETVFLFGGMGKKQRRGGNGGEEGREEGGGDR